MSIAKDELTAAKRICIGNDGKIVEVVEYKHAVAALNTQKAELAACFKAMLSHFAPAQALETKKSWSEYFDKLVQNI